MKIIHFPALCFIFIVLYLSTVCAQQKRFKFTAIPDQNDARLVERFSKVADYLSQELGVRVDYVPVKSYAASVAAFKNNEVQLAWFGGLSGVKARRSVKGALAIAQGEEDMAFYSYFIANTKTGILYSDEFPKNIRGKTFTFGSKGSTSGRLMPEYYIRKHMQTAPQKIFRRVGFSGDHSKTIALVQAGSYEVGAINFKVWETELEKGIIDTSKVRIIWRTPVYPDYNWTIRGDIENRFGSGFIKNVQTALTTMSDKDLLASFPRKRFIKADNSMYEPILETGSAIGIFDD